MKKKWLAVLAAGALLTSLFSVALMAGADDNGGFKTNLEGWAAEAGDWAMTDNGYQARANAQNLAYATTEIGKTDFRLEADIAFVSGNQQYNLHFGDKDDNTKRWYVVIQNADTTGANINIYGDDNGDGKFTRQLGWTAFPETSDKNAFHVTLEITDGRQAVLWIDDTRVNAGELKTDFEGGVFGLETFKTNAYFNNVTVTTADFSTNIDGWSGKAGTWTEVLKGYQVTSAGRQDNYAVSGRTVAKGKAFTYEADVTLPDGEIPANGCSVSLLYGITNPENMTEGNRLAATLDMANGFCRMFSFEKTTMKERIGAISNLTDEEKALRQFHIRLEVAEDGTMAMFLNGRALGTGKSEIYEGGYVGLQSFNTDAVFNNVVLTVEEETTGSTEDTTTTTTTTTTAATTTEDTMTEDTTTTTTESATTTAQPTTTATTGSATTLPSEEPLKPYVPEGLNNWNAENNPKGNSVKYADVTVGKEELVYEMDIADQDNANRQYNLIFGIADPSDPDNSARYEVRIQLGDSAGEANFSIYGYDTAQAKWVRQLPWKPLPAGSDKDAFHVKLRVTEEGMAEVYVDDSLVTSGQLALGYTGGGLGLSTFKSAASFKNVQITAESLQDDIAAGTDKGPQTGVAVTASAAVLTAAVSGALLFTCRKKRGNRS